MTNEIAKIAGITTKHQPGKVSTGMQQCDIEFVFTRLKTQTWRELRLIIQRRADIFAYNNDQTTAYAGFKLTPKNAMRVLDLYTRIHRMKSVFVRIKGSSIDTLGEGSKWIHCWIMAHATEDKVKYCTVKDYDPQLYKGITRWWDYVHRPDVRVECRLTLPCKNTRFRPKGDSPDQYIHEYMDAVRVSGCEKCPLFNPNLYKIRKLRPHEPTAREAALFWEHFANDPVGAIKGLVND